MKLKSLGSRVLGPPLLSLGATLTLVLTVACGSSETDGADSTKVAGNGDGDGDGGTLGDGDGGGDPNAAKCQDPDADFDGDGFTYAEGDCNDCDKNANPGAIDVPGNDVDDNCDRKVDNQDSCDADIEFSNSSDALDAAAAIGICAQATSDNRAWGVIEAKYTLADGTELAAAYHDQHALLQQFGDNIIPHEGQRLLSLSSGLAEEWQEGMEPFKARSGYRKQSSVSPPAGFPTASTSCPDVVLSETPVANDSIALELTIRAPSNAKSMAFDFYYFTYEFPEYVCHDYNDNFVVLMDPPPADAPDGNIAFDNKGNAISVNNAYLEVCDADEASAAGLTSYECPLGADDLQGTGFEILTATKTSQAGATGWLSTTVPIEPGQSYTLRFIIWDAGKTMVGNDNVNDSSVLIDNFRFSAEGASETFTAPVLR